MRGGLLQAEEPGRILLGHQVDLRLSEARVGEDPYREAEGFRRARVHCGAMRRLLIVHGPNLNLLGTREPAIYGSTTLADIDRTVADAGRHRSVEVRSVQSNSEGTIIDAIQEARGWADGIIINAGAYTHYSHAIADAITAVGLPAVEVHISNVYARESWRHHSVLGPVVVGSICGFGRTGYLLALEGLLAILDQRTPR